MSDKITDLTSLTSGLVDRATDVLEIADTSASASKKITPNALMGIAGSAVGDTDSQTLTNKTITAPNISSPVLSGTLTGTYTIGGTPTFPSSVVTLTGSQTLTNKVLTSPTINTATISNPTLTVDTVSEFTAANGVTIDGLNIKDSALTTANSVPNSTLSNSGVFNSNWAWASYAPTWTNVSGGTTTYARYTQIGKTVHFRVKYTLAGAGVSGSIVFSPPVAMSSNYTAVITDVLAGSAMFFDTSGGAWFTGVPTWSTSGNIALYVNNAAGTYTAINTATSILPFTWATGDIIVGSGSYEAA